jgi:hypothetical protein
MLWLVVSLIVPIWAAYGWVAGCDRQLCRDVVAVRVFRFCLAVGLALGLSSYAFFLWLFFVGVPGELYHACELTLFAGAGLFGWRRACTCGNASGPASVWPESERTVNGVLLWAFIICLAMAVLAAVGIYWKEPLGDWDSWAIWNQRARFLIRAGDNWRQAFSSVFAHPDYPLVLPCGNARLWSYLGAESNWAPWLFGCLFTFATIGLAMGSVCRLRGRCQGILVGLVLLGTVPLIERGFLQYADVPLSFFFLATVVLLVHCDESSQPCRGMLILAGLMAGLAAGTKNEGLLFLLVLPTAWCFVGWRRGAVRDTFRRLLPWSVGVAAILALVAIQKICLAGRNDMVFNHGWAALSSRLLDPWRYWCVVGSFVVSGCRATDPFVVVLPLCCLLLGVTRNRPRGMTALWTGCFVVPLMLAGHCMVWLTAPSDLPWPLPTSAPRLVLQVWPLTTWLLLLWLAGVDESPAALTEHPPTATLK